MGRPQRILVHVTSVRQLRRTLNKERLRCSLCIVREVPYD